MLPTARTGILFVGISDHGEINGVANTDALQEALRHVAESECYPPIWLNLQAVAVEGKKCSE